MMSEKFPGKFESLEKISLFFRNAAEQAGFNSFSVYAVETAVDEACSNIIEHGYKDKPGGDIECSYLITEIGLKIILVDYGTPFNPKSVPIPNIALSLEEREAHGLGLFFIRQWMDEFGYQADGENGNRTVMVKYRDKLP
jgi:serine/threonine-protein kinase RsbW